MSQHEQYQEPGNETTWNVVVSNVINYTCGFPAITRQNVCLEKGLSAVLLCLVKR